MRISWRKLKTEGFNKWYSSLNIIGLFCSNQEGLIGCGHVTSWGEREMFTKFYTLNMNVMCHFEYIIIFLI